MHSNDILLYLSIFLDLELFNVEYYRPKDSTQVIEECYDEILHIYTFSKIQCNMAKCIDNTLWMNAVKPHLSSGWISHSLRESHPSS